MPADRLPLDFPASLAWQAYGPATRRQVERRHLAEVQIPPQKVREKMTKDRLMDVTGAKDEFAHVHRPAVSLRLLMQFAERL